jgi:hypothetical protein
MGFSINSLSIKDIAQTTLCPSKLYWRYLGVLKGTRPYTRTVSPVELGKKGEEDILSMNTPVDEFVKKHFKIYDSMPGETVKLIEPKTKAEAEKLWKDVYNYIENNISLIESIDQEPIDTDYEISKVGVQVKEKYDLSVVIPKVSIYNPVYHYRGILDFIGLAKDGSTIIIDSKNIEKTKSYDDVQMNLYLDSFNKRILTPSSLQELPRVVNTILYQEKGETFLKILKDNEKNEKILTVINDWKWGAKENLKNLMGDDWNLSENLSDFEYGKKIEDLTKKHEEISDNINSRLFDLREEQKKQLIDILVHQKPDYGVIFNTRHTDKTKEITEVTIDLPEIVKSAWKIKKNLLTDIKEFIINPDSCKSCPYKGHCDRKFEIIEPEDIKDPAIPTLIHKAFMSYEKKEGFDIDLAEEKGIYSKTRLNYPELSKIKESIKKDPRKFIPKKYLTDYENKTIEEIIDANMQLVRYATAKKFDKINKEFNFWKIK